ncbi:MULTISPECIES: MmcQ/YjbR family DNA-binding protein [unclassified Avibacterium]|uniref:MmcQ/YjbR family DNA-binding protein n=1 Tax=unclassified Avibacterium TaxID=2685287 RepID=UPI0020272CFD|nr:MULTISPECIES: MmcQ/YjbR family DNA-binding protein [unclassified Avibacterium]MCW9716924.1 MmcQ/YjbR family DNA-binding protein [Avibacterium sp. 21-599]MCW9732207.1 MmcQ/YjbR family DNA-binding protein [Avibacterium sp. 20-15]URL04380.1 MmcQ/YjbR family DNA-binding protein [Avibacterium sp. 20-132]
MITPSQIIQYIAKHYQVNPAYLWAKFPEYGVFRHLNSGKWFAILMNIPGNKIGLSHTETIWIINVKAQPEMIGALRMIKGVYPAYHMNKEHWMSLHLAEISPSLLWECIQDSFSLTQQKKR